MNAASITTQQIAGSLLAIPAFLPATFCTGYVVAWLTDVCGFRKLTLVERVFWSLPLSLGISTIASVLIGRFLSLSAVAIFFAACAALCIVIVGRESLELRRAGKKWNFGFRPFGGTALIYAILWALVVVLLLVDFQSGHRLFFSMAIYDHAPRVDWTESVLHTGVPPENPLYLFQHASSMRYYYFWYVLCAAIVRMSHLSARTVFIASCVWAGFMLAALTGLYLKHFLSAGVRLRRQFLLAIRLFTVAGLTIGVTLLSLAGMLPGYSKALAAGQITSWAVSLLYDPHHVAAMVCCMFAFLLAWTAGRNPGHRRVSSVVSIALTLASAFGLSIYVTFAFFLVMIAWALWQLIVERAFGPVLLLGAGGAGALILLIPYLRELLHSDSKMQGGSLFAFSVRLMIPPDGLLATHLFQHLAAGHPDAALNLAKLILLAPGYALELGFYFVIFLIYLLPAWRGRIRLTAAQRSLLVIAAATFVLISVIRSGILETNDFGWRAALLLQFPLLLLASEAMTAWNTPPDASAGLTNLPGNTPQWLRAAGAFALLVGVLTTSYQVLMVRFLIPLEERARVHAGRDTNPDMLSHNAYISNIGYARLDAAISGDSVVQFNPDTRGNQFWSSVDWVGINRQTAIGTNEAACGSEFGGDPSGCKPMTADMNALFSNGTAESAHAICSRYGIQYLVARVYDPVWNDKSSWVWTLNPIVAEEDFRALDCR